MRELFSRLAVALVAGATVVFAAAADLASQPTETQRLWLWCMASSGIALFIATFLIVERLQGNNRLLRDELDHQKSEISEVRKSLSEGAAGVRMNYAVMRVERRLRRAIADSTARLPEEASIRPISWRVGIWSIDEEVWLLRPIAADNFDAVGGGESWDRPEISDQPRQVPFRQGSAAILLECTTKVVGGGSSTWMIALQVAGGLKPAIMEGERAEREKQFAAQARGEVRKILLSLSKREELSEEVHELGLMTSLSS